MHVPNKTAYWQQKLTTAVHKESLAWWWGYESRCVSRKSSVKII